MSTHDPRAAAAALVDRYIGIHDDFERALEAEINLSERLRARFFAAVFLGVGLAATAAALLMPAFFAQLFNGAYQALPVFLLMAAYALYEVLFQAALGVFARRGLRFPAPPRYGNAFIETSFPTVLLVLLCGMLPAPVALALPPVFVYFLFIILSALRLDPALSAATGLFSAAGYLGVVGWQFASGGLTLGDGGVLEAWAPWVSKALILVVGGLMAAFVAGRVRAHLISALRTREERNQIASIFGQHVSPAVMERLVHQQGDYQGEVREVAVLFLDIRDFTRYAHSRGPAEVMAYLNSLFGFMVDVVNQHHGVINKFLGDGFMAVFGAPLDDGEAARHAIDCARELTARLEAAVASGEVPPTRIGIGVHSGHAMTGTVGSRLRQEYTIIGDVVNLASRIEQLTKQLGASVLVSGEAWDAAKTAAGEAARGPAEPLGEHTVKGRATPVAIWRLA